VGVGQVFVPHSVQVKTGSIDAWIDQIVDANPDLGIELFEESGSGEVDREYVAVRERNPVLSLETTDLAFLGTCGMSGIDVVPASSKPGVVAFGKTVPRGGTRDAIASTTHLKCSISDGLMVPLSVEGAHNRAARLKLAMHAVLGSVATYSLAYPMVFAKDQAITSGGGATDILFVPAAVRYNDGSSHLISGLLNISLQFGLKVFKEGSNSEVDPTHVSIMAREPVFEFSSRDAELIDDIGEGGVSCSSFEMYFQKVTQNGERVSKATGAHISLISTAGVLKPGALQLPHNQPGEARFTFTPSKNTSILTIATNASIPTS
jgi:hypothetical protein